MSQSNNKNVSENYDENSIEVLEGLEPVRLRPGMYIGGTDKVSYHHLFKEVLENSADEALAGFATEITVELDENLKTVSVKDNGRGIPVAPHPKYGVSTLQVILTKLHSGGKFTNKTYANSSGLHGVGSSVVNALSSKMDVYIERDGFLHHQEYSRGNPIKDIEQIKQSKKTSTLIRFTPDEEIFGKDLKFDPDWIEEIIEYKSYIHKGLKIKYKFGNNEEREFFSTKGIPDLLEKLIKKDKSNKLHDVLEFNFEDIQNKTKIQTAFCWTESTDYVNRCFANGVNNSAGGTHEAGLRDGIAKSVRTYMEAHNISPKGLKIQQEDIREGVYCSVSIFLPNPQFQGQTKEKLNNVEIKSMVSNFVADKFESYMMLNPDIANGIVTRIIQAARARSASRDITEKIRAKAKQKSTFLLPGKLSDCQSDNIDDNEIWILEGDSAAGSAKQGRDRKFQAILPLKGKIMNVETASQSQILNNQEIQDLIKIIGCGYGPNFNLSNLRYGKIIIATDADCYDYETKITVLNTDSKEIKEYKIGEFVESTNDFKNLKVLSFNHTTETEEFKEIDNSVITQGSDKFVYKIKTEIGEIICSADQKLEVFDDATNNLVTTRARNLIPKNDFIKVTSNGKTTLSKILEKKIIKKYNNKLYDITVRDNHNFVSDHGMILHNCDGAHIGTLLLTFFYRFMPQLIKEGRIYLAQPPLYKIEWGKEKYWVLTDHEKDKIIADIRSKKANAVIVIQRFKGLGEMMPETLYETTMNPKTRTLIKTSLPPIDSIKIEEKISSLMGKDNSLRQQIIYQDSFDVDDLDV